MFILFCINMNRTETDHGLKYKHKKNLSLSSVFDGLPDAIVRNRDNQSESSIYSVLSERQLSQHDNNKVTGP